MENNPVFSNEFTPNFKGPAALRGIISAKQIGKGDKSVINILARLSILPARQSRTAYIKENKLRGGWENGSQVVDLDTLGLLYGKAEQMLHLGNLLNNMKLGSQIIVRGYFVERPFLSRHICPEINSILFIRDFDSKESVFEEKNKQLSVELPPNYGATLECSNDSILELIVANRGRTECSVCAEDLQCDQWGLKNFCAKCETV